MISNSIGFGTTTLRILDVPPVVASHHHGVVRGFIDTIGIPEIPSTDTKEDIDIRLAHNDKEWIIKLPELPNAEYCLRYISPNNFVEEPKTSFKLFRGFSLSNLLDFITR